MNGLDMKDCVVCPKPRRPSVLNDPIRSLRWQLSHQTELNDSKAGMDLMEIILSKGGNEIEQSVNTQTVAVAAAAAAWSAPFFCGSPPRRAENPLVQDARFGEEKVCVPVPVPLSPLSIQKGGCVRAKFGHKPAAVRIEGFEFDCLDRDMRNCSISAVA